MYRKLLLVCVSYLTLQFAVNAEELHIGTVYPSLAPVNEIIGLFEKTTTAKIVIHQDNFTSKMIYNQIKEKNDLDVVLFGDVKSATQLEGEGLINSEGRFTYAFGKLVLWSKNPSLVDTKGEILLSDKFRNIASLDPKIAPAYGVAAQEVLKKFNRWEALQSKLVFIENSGEIQKQVKEGKIDLALLPLSTLNPSKKIEGSLWIIPRNYYHQLEQQAVLLKKAENNPIAVNFFNYLKSPQARNIFEKYGYNLP